MLERKLITVNRIEILPEEKQAPEIGRSIMEKIRVATKNCEFFKYTKSKDVFKNLFLTKRRNKIPEDWLQNKDRNTSLSDNKFAMYYEKPLNLFIEPDYDPPFSFICIASNERIVYGTIMNPRYFWWSSEDKMVERLNQEFNKIKDAIEDKDSILEVKNRLRLLKF